MIRIGFIYICLTLSTGPGCAPVLAQGAGGEAGGLTLFVVRHGEAYQNLPSHAHIPGERQDALTPAGMGQAKKTGRHLRDKGIVVVVASPTGRTRQTARIISEEIGLGGAYREAPAFRSMKKGRTPEGKPVAWSWRTLQWEAGRDPRPQGGESLQDATTRAVLGVDALMAKYPGKAVVIVTHSDICAGLAGQGRDIPYHRRYAEYQVDLGSAIEIEIDHRGIWKMK